MPIQSRLIRGLYYEPGHKRLCVMTTRGNIHIYDHVPVEIVKEIATHEQPGRYYSSMEYELGTKVPAYSLAGLFSRMRARKALRKVAAPVSH